MVAIRWLSLTLLPLLAACFDPSVSNGTCYFAANKKAADSYIPCGNAAGGTQTCCQARDVCLSSNACFNGQYGVTYLAGCTDEGYNNAKCPSKGLFPNQQWAGLVRCFVSNGPGEEWAACEEKTQPKINNGNTSCKCDRSRSTAVFTEAAVLTPIASLPVSVGNAIAWSSGFEPSTTILDSTSTGHSSTRTTTSNMSGTPTGSSLFPSQTAPSDSPSELSTAAKAGIGVGTAGGVLAIGAILLWLGWFRRRRNRTIAPIKDQIRPSSLGPWNDGNDGDSAAMENHKSWGGKSELPTEANEVTTTKTSLGENTIRTTFNAGSTYQPYQHSPTTVASEMDGSPAASTSGLTPKTPTAYEKPKYGGPIYEMPA